MVTDTMTTLARHTRVAPPGAQAAPRVLVVDDVPLNRELMARILDAEGFRTLGAADGDEALRVARGARPDLILLDVVMPGRDGFAVCGELKSDRSLSDIPVIFLSSRDEPEDRLRGLRAGGVDYIAKPFHAEEVLARVRIHLRIRQALQAQIEQQEARLAQLREAQQSMLVRPEDLPEACFAVCFRPLDAVGGDIYDVLALGDGLFGYFAADISGHSIRASFLTSAVKALLRQYSGPLYTPEESLRSINAVMHSTLKRGQYLTACYARYYQQKRLLSILDAGHPAPIHVSAAGAASVFAVESDPLGVFGSVVLQKHEIALEQGDRFYLFTDGLIEDPGQEGGGRRGGLERLREACQREHGLPLAEAVEAISNAVRPPGEPVHDDLLLLAVEVRA